MRSFLSVVCAPIRSLAGDVCLWESEILAKVSRRHDVIVLQYFVVEHDEFNDPLDPLRWSLSFVRSFGECRDADRSSCPGSSFKAEQRQLQMPLLLC